MKTIICHFLFLIFVCHSSGVRAQDRLVDAVPHLETEAAYTVTVSPDRIYLSVRISEEDQRGKVPLEQIEDRLVNALRNLGIDIGKQLRVEDVFSQDETYFLRGKDVQRSKAFELLVYDAQTTGGVFRALKQMGVSQARITRTEYSKMAELKVELKAKAVEKAQRQARQMLAPLDGKIKRVLVVEDQGSVEINPRNNYTALNSNLQQANNMLAGQDGQLSFADTKVRSTVRVVFEIE